jgi:hypothetical protein
MEAKACLMRDSSSAVQEQQQQQQTKMRFAGLLDALCNQL